MDNPAIIIVANSPTPAEEAQAKAALAAMDKNYFTSVKKLGSTESGLPTIIEVTYRVQTCSPSTAELQDLDEPGDCAICSDQIGGSKKRTKTVRLRSCNQIFHDNCLRGWIKMNIDLQLRNMPIPEMDEVEAPAEEGNAGAQFREDPARMLEITAGNLGYVDEEPEVTQWPEPKDEKTCPACRTLILPGPDDYPYEDYYHGMRKCKAEFMVEYFEKFVFVADKNHVLTDGALLAAELTEAATWADAKVVEKNKTSKLQHATRRAEVKGKGPTNRQLALGVSAAAQPARVEKRGARRRRS